jgi:hypothetical protein
VRGRGRGSAMAASPFIGDKIELRSQSDLAKIEQLMQESVENYLNVSSRHTHLHAGTMNHQPHGAAHLNLHLLPPHPFPQAKGHHASEHVRQTLQAVSVSASPCLQCLRPPKRMSRPSFPTSPPNHHSFVVPSHQISSFILSLICRATCSHRSSNS